MKTSRKVVVCVVPPIIWKYRFEELLGLPQ
jgi:hypothetical protein